MHQSVPCSMAVPCMEKCHLLLPETPYIRVLYGVSGTKKWPFQIFFHHTEFSIHVHSQWESPYSAGSTRKHWHVTIDRTNEMCTKRSNYFGAATIQYGQFYITVLRSTMQNWTYLGFAWPNILPRIYSIQNTIRRDMSKILNFQEISKKYLARFRPDFAPFSGKKFKNMFLSFRTE